MNKPYFPMFVDLSDKNVVVVGAGTVATRRVRALAEFTERLTVVATKVSEELNELEKTGAIRILRKAYEREDIYDADLVIAATDDERVNGDIYCACKCLGIQVNVSSNRSKCDFYFPGVIIRDNLVIGVTASGQDHAAVHEITGKIRRVLDE